MNSFTFFPGLIFPGFPHLLGMPVCIPSRTFLLTSEFLICGLCAYLLRSYISERLTVRRDVSHRWIVRRRGVIVSSFFRCVCRIETGKTSNGSATKSSSTSSCPRISRDCRSGQCPDCRSRQSASCDRSRLLRGGHAPLKKKGNRNEDGYYEEFFVHGFLQKNL